jgi:hypothetical protein
MDFSRHVNDYIPKQAVKLSNLPEAEKMLEKGDWQTSFDLPNVYISACTSPSGHCWVSRWSLQRGKMIYFFFKVMIYGIKFMIHIVRF